MARLARVTIPNSPHHITQRGNRRQQTFFCDADYELYLDLLAEWCLFYGVEIWAYCLMPNHTHVIAVPKTEVALGRAMAETHRRYTRHINFEKKWKGHRQFGGQLPNYLPKLFIPLSENEGEHYGTFSARNNTEFTSSYNPTRKQTTTNILL